MAIPSARLEAEDFTEPPFLNIEGFAGRGFLPIAPKTPTFLTRSHSWATSDLGSTAGLDGGFFLTF
jgi:hypothetical protein